MTMTHHSITNTDSSDHQNSGRSQEGELQLPTEETVKRSTRCDGSRHSILENLGQTQSGGDDGDDVGCEEFSKSNFLRETKYPGEQTLGVRIYYDLGQTTSISVMKNCNKKISS